MTRFTTWTPADLAKASLADLTDLQKYRVKLKAELARHDEIFDAAMSARYRPNDFGARTIEVGEYKVKTDMPKRVKWNDGLGGAGVDGIRAKYDMTETAYKELTPSDREKVDQFRTVESGKINYSIERIEY